MVIIHLLFFGCGNSCFSKFMKRHFVYFVCVNALTFRNVCFCVDRRPGGQQCVLWAGCWRGRLGRSFAEKECLTRASTAITCWTQGKAVSSKPPLFKPPCWVGAVDLLKRLNLTMYLLVPYLHNTVFSRY